MRVEITDGTPDDQRIVLDGKNISDAVGGYTLTGKAGHLPTLVLDLPIPTTVFAGELLVDIRPEVQELLLDLGWTPPD